MFYRRSVTGNNRRLELRVRLLLLGAVVSMVGLYTQLQWVIWVAIVILALGLLMKVLPSSGDSTDGWREEEEG